MIQAQKLEIVDDPQSTLEDDNTGAQSTGAPHVEAEHESLSSEVKLDIHTPSQRRKRGRPKKNRAAGRKRRSSVKPMHDSTSLRSSDSETPLDAVLTEIPVLARESLKQIRQFLAMPFTIDLDPIREFILSESHHQGDGIEQLVDKKAIGALEILRSLIDDFKTDAPYIDQFKNHVLEAIDQLRDKTAHLNQTAMYISKIQKEKAKLRQMIVELKRQSKQIATELAGMKKKESKSKFEHDWITSIHERMNTLKQQVQESAPPTQNYLDTVEGQLNNLRLLLNPEVGVASKLNVVNEKLKEKEAEL